MGALPLPVPQMALSPLAPQKIILPLCRGNLRRATTFFSFYESIISNNGGVMNRRLPSLAWLVFVALIPAPASAQPDQRDPIPERALVKAVEKGDRAKVLSLLSQGADINKIWINDTPLETAIFQQNLEMVKLLLDKGAKIKADNLADAAHGAQGDKEKALTIVTLLIARGADVRAAGGEALINAAIANNLEVVRLLLSKGSNPNARTESGVSVLMAVVPYDSLDSIRALLEAGADVKATNENHETALMHAARSDHRTDTTTRVTLLKLLIDQGSEVKARDKNGSTVLHYAVANIMTEGGGFISRPEVVRVLLDNGAEPNARDDRGETALIRIAQTSRSSIEISRALIEKGTDVNLSNNQGVTALMFSAAAGQSELVQLLLDKGALLDARDNQGRTAMVHAVESGQAQVTELLAHKGADLALTPFKDEAGLKASLHKSMLVRAVSYGKAEEVKTLLRSGVDPNARTGPRNVPVLLIASGYSHDVEIVSLLLNSGANVDEADDQGITALMEAARANIGEVVSILLAHQAKVNLQNKDQKSALMITAAEGHKQIAEQLVAKGADVNARDLEGRTALILGSMSHYAQEELVKLLLAKGADVNATDNEGNTSLMLAAKAGAFQVIGSLIAAGANVNAKNKEGWSALKFARESKDTEAYARAEIVKQLAKAGAKE
jgi:ankyrin repeat protein